MNPTPVSTPPAAMSPGLRFFFGSEDGGHADVVGTGDDGLV
jgi:hypothetical protein